MVARTEIAGPGNPMGANLGRDLALGILACARLETAKEAQGRLSIVKGWNKRHEKEYAAAPVEIPFPATAGKKAFSPQPMETQPALTVQNGTGSLRTRFTS